MIYIKLFEEYSNQSKFEILLDSIVEVMDEYGFKEYE